VFLLTPAWLVDKVTPYDKNPSRIRACHSTIISLSLPHHHQLRPPECCSGTKTTFNNTCKVTDLKLIKHVKCSYMMTERTRYKIWNTSGILGLKQTRWSTSLKILFFALAPGLYHDNFGGVSDKEGERPHRHTSTLEQMLSWKIIPSWFFREMTQVTRETLKWQFLWKIRKWTFITCVLL
jgi:hypothetical protein